MTDGPVHHLSLEQTGREPTTPACPVLTAAGRIGLPTVSRTYQPSDDPPEAWVSVVSWTATVAASTRLARQAARPPVG
jgi:hypothetical protein